METCGVRESEVRGITNRSTVSDFVEKFQRPTNRIPIGSQGISAWMHAFAVERRQLLAAKFRAMLQLMVSKVSVSRTARFVALTVLVFLVKACPFDG